MADSRPGRADIGLELLIISAAQGATVRRQWITGTTA